MEMKDAPCREGEELVWLKGEELQVPCTEGVVLIEVMLRCRGVGIGLNNNYDIIIVLFLTGFQQKEL